MFCPGPIFCFFCKNVVWVRCCADFCLVLMPVLYYFWSYGLPARLAFLFLFFVSEVEIFFVIVQFAPLVLFIQALLVFQICLLRQGTNSKDMLETRVFGPIVVYEPSRLVVLPGIEHVKY